MLRGEAIPAFNAEMGGGVANRVVKNVVLFELQTAVPEIKSIYESCKKSTQERQREQF